MQRYQPLFLFLLSGLISLCIGAEPDATNIQMMESSAKKTILVTFVDRTITRSPLASLTRSYRRSGSYKSSTWSRNIAERLAKDYQLKNLFEWPITVLGVQCVVFEVPDDRSVDAILEVPASDEQVDSAQRMGIFKMQTAGTNGKDPYYILQTSMYALQLEEAHRLATGKGIEIGLIDTGVEFHHPDLEGQIVPDNNFAAHLSDTFSGDIHGTAVAGVMVAQINNGIGIIGGAGCQGGCD